MSIKLTKKIATALTAFTALFVLVLSNTAGAMGEGQIAGGDIYRVKNVTKNTDFSDTAFADKCETVQYKVRMHNGGPGIVTNVNVKATLPSNASTTNISTVTITGQNAQPSTVTDTATLKLSSALEVSYISGSTQLLDTYSHVISNLPDGILNGGVNIGNVGVSLNEIKFVQFKAKVECPKPECKHDCNPCKDNPQTPEDECHPCIDNPKTEENECKPETPPTTPPQTPPSLPNTGPGDVIAAFFGVSSLSSILYYAVTRKLSKSAL